MDDRPSLEQREKISASQQFPVMPPCGCKVGIAKTLIPDHIVDEHSEPSCK